MTQFICLIWSHCECVKEGTGSWGLWQHHVLGYLSTLKLLWYYMCTWQVRVTYITQYITQCTVSYLSTHYSIQFPHGWMLYNNNILKINCLFQMTATLHHWETVINAVGGENCVNHSVYLQRLLKSNSLNIWIDHYKKDVQFAIMHRIIKMSTWKQCGRWSGSIINKPMGEMPFMMLKCVVMAVTYILCPADDVNNIREFTPITWGYIKPVC